MNCRKYADKAQRQKDTWLREVGTQIPYYHVIGDTTLDTNWVFDEDRRILYVKTEDDYISLPKKVVAAFEAVYCTFHFSYIFKTDDDQELFTTNTNTKTETKTQTKTNIKKKKFFQIVETMLTNNINETNVSHYGGYIVNVEQPYLSQYNVIHPELPKNLPILKTKYCSGRFYFLSKLAVQDIITKKQRIRREYLEDYAIGYHLEPTLKTNMINLQTNKYLRDCIIETQVQDTQKME